MKKITIKELAKMAGVSVATVSRVMNNHPQGVSQSKREEILELARAYNYTPNLIAKSMVTHKTQCIGLLVPDILNPFFQNLARGIEDYAGQFGYSIFLCNTDNNEDKYMKYIQAMLGKNVDGLILTGYPLNKEEELRGLLKLEKVVSIDRYIEDEHFCQIITDNYQSAYEMTSYLISQGHKRIACLTGPNGLYINEERLRGYKDALAAYQISFDQELIREGTFELASGVKEGKWFLEHTDATVLFCFNDLMAQGVYKACWQMGKSIPEDLSLVGFDDIYTAELMTPALTTIKQPNYEIGQAAAEILVKWIEGEEPSKKSISFGNSLVLRQTVKNLNHNK